MVGMSIDGQYRKIPVVIRAARVDALIDAAVNDWAALPAWAVAAYERGDLLISPDSILVKTLEGDMRADLDDWLIEGVKGEIYPCDPEIFSMTYEPAQDGAA